MRSPYSLPQSADIELNRLPLAFASSLHLSSFFDAGESFQNPQPLASTGDDPVYLRSDNTHLLSPDENVLEIHRIDGSAR